MHFYYDIFINYNITTFKYLSVNISHQYQIRKMMKSHHILFLCLFIFFIPDSRAVRNPARGGGIHGGGRN